MVLGIASHDSLKTSVDPISVNLFFDGHKLIVPKFNQMLIQFGFSASKQFIQGGFFCGFSTLFSRSFEQLTAVAHSFSLALLISWALFSIAWLLSFKVAN